MGATARSPFRASQRERAIPAIVAVAAALAAAAPADPTGFGPWDALLRAAFAAGLTLAASQARRWTWIVLAGVALAASGGGVVSVVAAVALAGALAATLANRRDRAAGALIGAAVAQVLLRLDTGLPSLLPSFAGLVAVLPVTVSAYRASTAKVRSRVNVTMAGVAIAAALAGSVGTLSMLRAKSHTDGAVSHARAGLIALRHGDDEVAFDELQQSEEAFDAVSAGVDAPWARPGRLVPVLGQHLAVLGALGADGSSLSQVAARTSVDLKVADVIVDGNVDLGQVDALSPSAHAVLDALRDAADAPPVFDSPWLLPEVQDRLAFYRDDLVTALDSAKDATDALDAAPDLLGADETKRYLVLVLNPAESRELGGIVGDYGYLTADRGDLHFDGAVDVTDLNLQLAAKSPGPVEGLEPMTAAARPHRFGQNWSASPDFPTVARVAQELVTQLDLPEPDGVIAVDPYVLQKLLTFTGSVPVEGYDRLVGAKNCLAFVLRDQYLAFAGPAAERKEAVGQIADEVFDRLFDGGQLPDPRRFADAMAPLVKAGRLHATSSLAAQALRRAGLSEGLDSTKETDDYLLTQGNTRPNKLDAYLHRKIDLVTQLDGDDVRTTVTVRLTSDADLTRLNDYVTAGNADGLPLGTDRVNLNLYSSHELDGVSVQGRSAGTASLAVFGRHRYSATVDVPAGGTVTVVFRLHGRWAGDDYRIRVLPAAVAIPDDVGVDLTSEKRRMSFRRTQFAPIVAVMPVH